MIFSYPLLRYQQLSGDWAESPATWMGARVRDVAKRF